MQHKRVLKKFYPIFEKKYWKIPNFDDSKGIAKNSSIYMSIGTKFFAFYREGLLRCAFLKVMRTIWECTPKIFRDQMGVHSKNQKGPYGSALLIPKGTKWECTPKSKRDHMGVHSYLKGTKWECTHNF